MIETGKQKHVKVIGIGNSGVKIASRLYGLEMAGRLNITALDTDGLSLEQSSLPNDKKLLLDGGWRKGKGCGGDVLKGQRSMARERGGIEKLLDGASLLILTGGLGGGTATGGAPAFAGVAKKMEIPTIFVMTMPFSLEGHSKRKIAEDGIRELLPVVDVLLCLPNDLLFSTLPADTLVTDAFKNADLEVARAILGVSELVSVGNLLPADLADLSSVLNQKKSVCSIGVGVAASSDGLNRCHLALERMLDSPLLGGVTKLKEADAVFLSLTGGPDLSIGDTKKTFDAAIKFIGNETKVIIGANTDQTYSDMVQVTAITVNFDKQEKKPGVSKSDSFLAETRVVDWKSDEKSVSSTGFEQGELPLQNISRGIFLNTTQVAYDGEDLDIPTFQRRMVIVDKGE
ncbi:MAG: hypothetical protein WC071_06070 [Victivallaceae bacterium]